MSVDHTPTWRRLSIWSVVALFYFYENILTTCLGVMTEDLMQHFSITHTQVGLLASSFFTAYALMQIPVGWLIQRFSVRNCATIAALLCVMGSWMLASTTCFTTALFARAMMGIGASFAPLCAFEVAALYFQPRRFAMLTGLLLTFGSLGGIVGQAPFRVVLELCGFQNSLMITGSIGFIIALTSYFIIPCAQSDEIHTITFKKLFSAIQHINIWWIILYAAFMYGPYLVLQSMWGKPFIEEALHLSARASATMLQMMMLGFLIGGPILGYLSDYFNRRKIFLTISSVSTGLLVLALLHPAFSQPHIFTVILFLIGLSCSGFLISFTMLKQAVTPQLRSISLGIMNSMNTLGGIMLPPLIGAWVKQNIESGAQDPYRSSLVILPIVILIAIICGLAIKESKEKS